MLKYKWTPFQLFALVSFTIAICEFVSIAKIKGDPGLGGLAPFVYLAFAVGIVLLDVIFQYLLRKFQEVFFITEVILCLAFVVWMYSLYQL